jgi:hypothetical protein
MANSGHIWHQTLRFRGSRLQVSACSPPHWKKDVTHHGPILDRNVSQVGRQRRSHENFHPISLVLVDFEWFLGCRMALAFSTCPSPTPGQSIWANVLQPLTRPLAQSTATCNFKTWGHDQGGPDRKTIWIPSPVNRRTPPNKFVHA